MNEEYIKKLEEENKLLMEKFAFIQTLQEENEKLKAFNAAQARMISNYLRQDSGGWTSDYDRKPIGKKGSSYE